MLSYCAEVAEQEAGLDQVRKVVTAEEKRQQESRREAEDGMDEWTRRVEVEQRLDPYSSRMGWEDAEETPGEILARVVKSERTVEEIVRARTWNVVAGRCEGGAEGWENVREGLRQREERR